LRLLDADSDGFQCHRAPFRHCVAGVDTHVEERLLKVTGFCIHPQVLAPLVDGDRDISVKSALHHPPHTVKYFVNAHRLYLLPLRTCKAQELARQVGGALGGLLNHAHGVLQGIIGTQPVPSQ
jgi:hypothetical protein